MSQTTPTRVKYYRSARTITGWTIVMLVLLRVAVGWHFFYEGVWKLKSGGGFSATPYLMAATGPLDFVFHSLVDDMDGTKKRMTQEYLYKQLDNKCAAILKFYGATDPQSLPTQDKINELQKKVNGGLTDLQLNTISRDAETQRKTVDTLRAKQELLAKDNKPLSPEDTETLAKAMATLDRHLADLNQAAKVKESTKPSAADLENLASLSKKLTKEQVESLKAYVERKKHGVKDEYAPASGATNVAELFENGKLFVKQVSYAGEYADPANPDNTRQITTVTYAALADQQGEIVKNIQGILDSLDKAVKAGVSELALAADQTVADRKAQLDRTLQPLPAVKIVPDGATDTSWLTKAYVEKLVNDRYAALKKAYDLTERQDKSKYGSFYCQMKISGPYDKKCVDFVLSDPDFKNDLANYADLLVQIAGQKKQLQTPFDDQRLVFDNGKRRDGLRNKLLARVEAAQGDIDLPKIQGLGEYIGPIKELNQAQVAAGPVPANPRELEFPGKLLKQAGWDVPKKTLTYWCDLGMMLGLTVVGACLILGLFTRLAAIGGTIMLAMFYLAMPPFPFLGVHVPENAAEGHYLWVNKNLIEMLVMLVFATSGIGRWFGLDSFLHAIFGRRTVETPADAEKAMLAQSGSGPVISTTRAFPQERPGTRP